MKTPFDLTGKTILVTGASSGIGRECCLQIAAMGGTVVLTARSEARLEETRRSLQPGAHSVIAGDIWDLTTSGRLVTALPELDGVVHSAGITKLVPVKMISEALLQEISRINYDAPVLLSQQMLKSRRLKSGASVVFITSIAAKIATRGNSVYSGLKAALCSFSRVMALEVSTQRIRVNCISPGQVRTPFMDTTGGPISADMFAAYEKQYPLGFGEAVDVANGAVYLLSDASRWVTGSDLVMDGGFLLA